MNTDQSERDPVEVLAEEFLERRRRNETPTPDDYARQHPDLAERIRTVFPALMLLDELSPEISSQHRSVVPVRIGEFRIVRQIGRGGMGVVYEAVQESLDRRVALKVLPVELARDATYLERFRSEARTAARLHHTNIVAVHGAGQADGQHFLVMQLIQGVGLDAVIMLLRGLPDSKDRVADTLQLASWTDAGTNGKATRIDSPVELTQSYRQNRAEYYRTVAQLIGQAASALAYAHQMGVVHRDVKPSNLLLDKSGSLFVSDFGLAKVEGSADLTRTGLVVGTPKYLAPERFDGVEGAAGDVFALGATLYELLALRPAFEGSTREQLMRQIRGTEPRLPSQLIVDVPRDLETIALAALRKDPRGRPAAQAIADDLHAWLDGRAIQARRVGPVERLAIWARRNPLVATLTVGLFVALASGLGVSLGLWRISENHRISAEAYAQEADRRREQSEATMSKAIDSLDDYFQSVSETKLLNAPGLQPLRKELLTSALRYYEGFLESNADHPRLQAEAARAAVNIGRIQVAIGSRDEARRTLEAAVERCREVVKRDPSNAAANIQLSRACSALATIYSITSRQPLAIKYYRESGDNFEAVHDRAVQQNKVWSLLRCAELEYEMGKMADATADLEVARQRLKPLLETYPQFALLHYTQARACYLAAQFFQESNPAQALTEANEACRAMEHVIQAEPEQNDYRREFGRCVFQRGNCELRLKQNDKAIESYLAAIDVASDLYRQNPQVHDYALAVVTYEANLAKALRYQGQFDQAIERLNHVRSIIEPLVDQDPNDSVALNKKAFALIELAIAYNAKGKLKDYGAWSKLSGDAYAELARREPHRAGHRVNLGASRGNEANAYRRLMDFEKGREIAREAIAIQRLVLADPHAAGFHAAAKNLLSNPYFTLLECDLQVGTEAEVEKDVADYVELFPNSADVLLLACKTLSRYSAKATPDVAQRFGSIAAELFERAVHADAAKAKKSLDAGDFKTIQNRDEFRRVAKQLAMS